MSLGIVEAAAASFDPPRAGALTAHQVPQCVTSAFAGASVAVEIKGKIISTHYAPR
jgi:hypothetical protein